MYTFVPGSDPQHPDRALPGTIAAPRFVGCRRTPVEWRFAISRSKPSSRQSDPPRRLGVRVRILHLTTEFPPLVYGGLGTAVGGLAAASVRCGIEVAIFLVGADGDPSYQRVAGYEPVLGTGRRVLQGSGIRVVAASHFSAEERGIRFTREWRPDVLHLHSFWLWPVAEAIRRRTGVPIVYTVHSLDRAEYEIGQGPPECMTQWQIQEWAVSRSDAIIALTGAERDLIEEYLPGSCPVCMWWATASTFRRCR
jgi:glycosyltransferase involved in cell wall biosynthesis